MEFTIATILIFTGKTICSRLLSYLKNLVWTPRPFTPPPPPPQAGGKNAFFETDFEPWPLCNQTRYQQSEITFQSTGTPVHVPNLVNFGAETAENGWWVFAHPLNFRIGRHCHPYHMEVIYQSTCKLYVTARAYSLGELTLCFAMHLVLFTVNVWLCVLTII